MLCKSLIQSIGTTYYRFTIFMNKLRLKTKFNTKIPKRQDLMLDQHT